MWGFPSLEGQAPSVTACIHAGKGRVRVGGEHYDLVARDTFVVPAWFPVTVESEEDMILFGCSDQIRQEKLDLFREARGNG